MKKKNRIWLYALILMGFVLILINNCKKKDSSNPANTNPANNIKDIDGNVYHTITIGTQVWMVENLKTTKYRNGDPIPNITDNTQWSILTTGAYCDYDNIPGNSTIYGKLYNFYAVSDTRNLCLTGWHVPNDGEWTTLTDYLGGESVAGGKLKETGTTHWHSPNTGATNSSGFTALPSGYCHYDGTFSNIGGAGYWWSSTVSYQYDAWYRVLIFDGSDIVKSDFGKYSGFSVRCLRD